MDPRIQKMQGFLCLGRAGSSGSSDTRLSSLLSLCWLHSQTVSSQQKCSLRHSNENVWLPHIPRHESPCLYAMSNAEPITAPKGMQSWLAQPWLARLGKIIPTQVWAWKEGVRRQCFPEENQDVIVKGRMNGNWTKKTTDGYYLSQVYCLCFRQTPLQSLGKLKSFHNFLCSSA